MLLYIARQFGVNITDLMLLVLQLLKKDTREVVGSIKLVKL